MLFLKICAVTVYFMAIKQYTGLCVRSFRRHGRQIIMYVSRILGSSWQVLIDNVLVLWGFTS